ncbi:hypothetical protein JCM4814A_92500 [Streptomyces phaeofaciens JCM 4814]|uniref:Uncharacterized protein n=1 Tax=Streptomyces phaeofaciens TaxID=68254 RepID=A0A918HL10_9ACTN|nr:hypothetical protein GCM10010226_55840 [Streptomyces phaeofaciens]
MLERGLGGLVAADRSRPAHDVVVEPPAGRLVECGDGSDAGAGCFLRGESFSDLPASCLCTGRTGRRNREETPMMVTGLVVIGALLVGACSWHLMRRYKGRS